MPNHLSSSHKMVFTRSLSSFLRLSITTVVMLMCLYTNPGHAKSGRTLGVHETLPGDMYLRFYLFNVTNPDEFEAGEDKPALEQVGPFIFREITEKFNVTHSADGATTSYAERKYYEFFPELSVDSEGLINFINVPLMSFGKNLAMVPLIGVNMFKSLVKAKEKIIKKNIPIKDFFYGYDAAPFLKIIEILLPGEPLPPQFEGGTFGLLKDRNGTEDGPFEVGTGATSEYEYGQLVSWKGVTQLDWWPGDAPNYCNMINGSVDDSTNRDIVELQHYHMYVFLPDACRSLKYTYSEEVAFGGEDGVSSIVGLKYKFDEHMLKNLDDNPENTCFCASPGEDNKNCLRTGAMDLGPCRKNAPMALTYPHFLDADPYYLEIVKSGLEPQRELHESYMIVEPRTGTILQDVKRMQLNVHLKPTPAFNYLKNLPDMLFPVLWTEKVYSLDKATLADLAQELNDGSSRTAHANLVESWRARSQEEKNQKSQQRNQEDKDKSVAEAPPVDEQAHVHGHHGGNTNKSSRNYFSLSLIASVLLFLHSINTK